MIDLAYAVAAIPESLLDARYVQHACGSTPSMRCRSVGRLTAVRSVRAVNGPEFAAQALADWADEHDVELVPIKPGKPTRNAYVERFNWTFREEVLSVYAFSDLGEVRDESTRWLYGYNHDRPHRALGRQTPAGYLARHEKKHRRLGEPSVRGCAPHSDLPQSN